MEGAAEESLSQLVVVPEGTVGSTGRSADMGEHMVHAVPLLPLAGYVDALRLVACSDGHREKGLLHLRPLGDTNADPRGIVAAYKYGYGLLALYPETAWSFLRIYHRHNGCGSPIVGLPLCA